MICFHRPVGSTAQEEHYPGNLQQNFARTPVKAVRAFCILSYWAMVLGHALYKDYDYFGADAVAEDLAAMADLDVHTVYTLGDFYTQTRRYRIAKEILRDGIARFPENRYRLEEKLKDAEARELGKENGGKVQFMPNPKENKEEVRQQYVEFLDSIGIAAEVLVAKRTRKGPDKIPRGEYPGPVETRDSGFRSFVAFYLETTGVNTKIDAITEFGAVRVVDGVVSEAKEFTFQELVHPYKRKISDEVAEKTGITNDMVKDSREMWEVFQDFADFVGDDILVGFNCVEFDARFLVRAGRYSKRIITNKYFDVMRMAKDVYGKDKISLGELADELDVVNPQAHRVLSGKLDDAPFVSLFGDEPHWKGGPSAHCLI